MKAFKLLAIGLMLLFAGSAQSQLSINVHLGTAPAWGPAGSDNVQYYYLPDVQAYYDVHTSMFIYISGNYWVRSRHLPSRYRNYDLYHGYKVVMKDYHGNSPYKQFKEHKIKYAKGYRGEKQSNMGDRKQVYHQRRPVVVHSNKKIETHHENSQANQKKQKHSGNNDKGHGKNKK
ncbi:MAG: hypothetical protein PHS59_03040 [Paludibacter sp.]|nr:hypothetical protein [Paludibacter sp.]